MADNIETAGDRRGVLQRGDDKPLAIEQEADSYYQERLALARSRASALEKALAEIELELADLRTNFNKQTVELDAIKVHLSAVTTGLIQKETQLNRITSTFGWRLLTWYGPIKYRFILPVLKRLKNPLQRKPIRDTERISAPVVEPEENGPDLAYQAWARRCEAIRYDAERARGRLASLKTRAVISIVMPVYNPVREHLAEALDSVLDQYYPDWELCIADDGSSADYVKAILDSYAAQDSRIKVVYRTENGGISAASNDALALASGEFIALLDHDDVISPDALLQAAIVLDRTDADLVYSDEDKLDEAGARCEPFFKPAWCPDLLLSCNYITHFGVYRKSIVDRIGGFRSGVEGGQDYDLILRFTEESQRIAHIPAVLYHWRKSPASAARSIHAKSYAYESSRRALTDALARRRISASVEATENLGFYRVKRSIVSPGKISIIIPTRDRLALLETCISSIESKTEYRDYEIIIVDNWSKNAATLDYLSRTRHRVIRDEGVFNFARLNNLAAKAAAGQYLVLLNNDTEVISGEWLGAMLEHAQRSEVGVVGAKLVYPQGLIQHAGVILGLGGIADHSQRLVEYRRGTGYANFPNVIRNYSAVTAACMMIRRDLYKEVGGLNEEDLPVAFNDVDLCLRLRKLGYLIVYTPFSVLYHKESASRGLRVDEREMAYMAESWGAEIIADPNYNPNLTLTNNGFKVDFSKPEALYCTYSQDLAAGLVPRVNAGDRIGQYFFAGQDNLSAIGVRFESKNQRREGKLIFRLRASHESADDLTSIEVDASTLRDDGICTFSFQPIPDSRGRMFYFSIELAHGSSPLTLHRSSVTNDAIGPHFRNEAPSDGTLTFKVYSHGQFR